MFIVSLINTLNGKVEFRDFESEKCRNLVEFRANLVEFRGEKGVLWVVLYHSVAIRLSSVKWKY